MSTSAARPHVVAIDQGTTGTTVLVVELGATPGGDRVVGRGYREIPQSFPAPGWVEHDAEAIGSSVVEALGDALTSAGATAIAAIGITNQRETVVAWDKATGRPLAPAIVWQDRRTTEACERLRHAGHEPRLQEITGLVIDPYFSASKMAWLLDHVPGLRPRAERGEVALGTIDSFLLARLTGRPDQPLTDVTNASRTQLFDITNLTFSPELAALFGVPLAALPAVRPSAGVFGFTRGVPALADSVPVAGVAGDQQAALFGQRCVQPGQAKCTYGTGAFLLMNVGAKPAPSRHRLLSTVAWQIQDRTTYALEGSAFVSGALVQWLRDGLGLIGKSADIEPLAQSVPDSGGVTIVPALAGLGAPHWRADARGLITGLTRGTTRAHIARAALEAMALDVAELAAAMASDAGQPLARLRVDGGASANDLLMQLQADVLGVEVIRPRQVESTALGAARLAAIGASLRPLDSAARDETADDEDVTRFVPRIAAAERDAALARWRQAVAKA